MVAHTGLEPVVSALRGQRVSRLHQCAAADWHYRFAATQFASFALEFEPTRDESGYEAD